MATDFTKLKAEKSKKQENLLSTFERLQERTTTNLQDVAAQQPIDVEMFKNTTGRTQELVQQRNNVQQGFVQQMQELAVEHDNATELLTNAQNRPFNNFIAWMNDDPETTDYLAYQRQIQGKMNRLAKDNQTTTDIFNKQIGNVQQELANQLGLSDFKVKQTGVLNDLLNKATATEANAVALEVSVYKGMSLPTLKTKLQGAVKAQKAGTPFAGSPGLIIAEIQFQEDRALDLLNKKRQLRMGKDPKKSDILSTIDERMAIKAINAIDMGAPNFKFENRTFTRRELAGIVSKENELRKETAVLMQSARTETQQALAQAEELNKTNYRLLTQELLPAEKGNLKASENALMVVTSEVSRLQAMANTPDAAGKTKQPSLSELSRLENFSSMAKNARNLAVSQVATRLASEFENEVANKAMVSFWKGEGLTSNKGAQAVGTSLALNSTPATIATTVSPIISSVVEDFYVNFSEGILSNFDTKREGTGRFPEEGKKKTISFSDLINDFNANKFNGSVEWQIALNRPALNAKGEPVGKREEKSYYRANFAAQIAGFQLASAARSFMDHPDVKNNPAFNNSLITTGGRLIPKLQNAIDTPKEIIRKISEISAQLKMRGSLPETSNLSAVFISEALTAERLAIADGVFNAPSAGLAAMIKGLYGSPLRAANSYTANVYEKLLRNIDTLAKEREMLGIAKAKQLEADREAEIQSATSEFERVGL